MQTMADGGDTRVTIDQLPPLSETKSLLEKQVKKSLRHLENSANKILCASGLWGPLSMVNYWSYW